MNTTSNLTFFGNDAIDSVKDTSYARDVMATARKMHWVTSTICGIFFLIIGLVGNSLSIIIWQKKSMKSSTGCYLIAQAINDNGVLLFFFATDSLGQVFPDLKASYAYGIFYAYIGYPFFFFFVVNSIWTLVGVTIDRYIQVCWINQAKTMCNQKAAKTGIVLITILNFIINLPHFNTYYPIPADARDPTTQAYDFTEFGQGTESQMYEFWVHCMFLVLVPWITIMTLNTAIIRRVTKLNKQMVDCRGEKAQMKAQRKENQLTTTLLSITFTFLILIALQCITQCFFMMKPEISDMRIVEEAFSVAKLGIIINSSINFILYCVTAPRFRNELRLTIYKICHWRIMVPMPANSDLYTVDDRSQTRPSMDSNSSRLTPATSLDHDSAITKRANQLNDLIIDNDGDFSPHACSKTTDLGPD